MAWDSLTREKLRTPFDRTNERDPVPPHFRLLAFFPPSKMVAIASSRRFGSTTKRRYHRHEASPRPWRCNTLCDPRFGSTHWYSRYSSGATWRHSLHFVFLALVASGLQISRGTCMHLRTRPRQLSPSGSCSCATPFCIHFFW